MNWSCVPAGVVGGLVCALVATSVASPRMSVVARREVSSTRPDPPLPLRLVQRLEVMPERPREVFATFDVPDGRPVDEPVLIVWPLYEPEISSDKRERCFGASLCPPPEPGPVKADYRARPASPRLIGPPARMR